MPLQLAVSLESCTNSSGIHLLTNRSVLWIWRCQYSNLNSLFTMLFLSSGTFKNIYNIWILLCNPFLLENISQTVSHRNWAKLSLRLLYEEGNTAMGYSSGVQLTIHGSGLLQLLIFTVSHFSFQKFPFF